MNKAYEQGYINATQHGAGVCPYSDTKQPEEYEQWERGYSDGYRGKLHNPGKINKGTPRCES